MDQISYFVASADPHAVRVAEAALDAAKRRVPMVPPRPMQLHVDAGAARTLARLRSGAVDALVIDARGESLPIDESPSLAVMRALFGEHAVAGSVARDRTWLVVDTDERGAALAFEAGKTRLAGVLAEGAGSAGWDAIRGRIVETTSRTRGGKVALCLAGGGTEGLFYELGALRALQRFLPSFSLTDVDIVCGISAGAFLGALLANGIGAEEITNGLRTGTGRILPIGRREIFDLDVGAFGRRAAKLSWELLRGRRGPLSALFRLPPAGIFAGARLRRWLKAQLSASGMVDRFEDLPRSLFIGATDQDTTEHVVFGAPGAPTVPIHQAVRASTALAPFYAPERIGGRYYVDGGFTRTTNMRVAVEQGATLVLLVDPLVPVSSPRPGLVAERGGVFVAMQGLKSLIHGRFDKAVPTLKAMYPHVAFHLFQPGEASRRIMGGSPMRYFYREAIEEMAYREVTRELRTNRATHIAHDLERHGIRFEDPDARKADDHELDDVRVVA